MVQSIFISHVTPRNDEVLRVISLLFFFSYVVKFPCCTQVQASVTKAQIKEIAELKMPDLNAASVETAMSMIEGTAKSMGFTVTD